MVRAYLFVGHDRPSPLVPQAQPPHSFKCGTSPGSPVVAFQDYVVYVSGDEFNLGVDETCKCKQDRQILNIDHLICHLSHLLHWL